MKRWLYYTSMNDWEYSGRLIITANEVKNSWSGIRIRNDSDFGDTITADGVVIQFDEEFEF
jgi:hypothetical protein